MRILSDELGVEDTGVSRVSNDSEAVYQYWQDKEKKTGLVGRTCKEYKMPTEHSSERTNSWFYKQIPKFNKEIWVRIQILLYQCALNQ